MTKAEIERYLEGVAWRLKSQAQFDYMLADLIGVSVARILDKDVKFPSVEEAYPLLFTENIQENKQKEEETRMISSANNFLAFANRHNARMKGAEKQNDN